MGSHNAIINIRNWIIDIHNCIVDINKYRALWLSLTELGYGCQYSIMDVHHRILDIHNYE